MKILVFSDSHGAVQNIKKALDEHLKYGAVDRVFFLGDGARDIISIAEMYPTITFDYVLGNCDSSTSNINLLEKLITVEGVKFMLTHGHGLGVKSGYYRAADYAIDKGADVLLYGHTHVAADISVDGSYGGRVRMINPGSCGSLFFGSYATLHIEGRNVVCGFGKFE